MKNVFFAFLTVYLVFLSLDIINIFIFVYKKTGAFPISRDNFYSPIKPALIAICIQIAMGIILSKKNNDDSK